MKLKPLTPEEKALDKADRAADRLIRSLHAMTSKHIAALPEHCREPLLVHLKRQMRWVNAELRRCQKGGA